MEKTKSNVTNLEQLTDEQLADLLNRMRQLQELSVVLECSGFWYPASGNIRLLHIKEGEPKGIVLEIPLEILTQGMESLLAGLKKRNRLVNRWELAQIAPDFDAQLIKLRSTYPLQKGEERCQSS